MNKVKFKMKVQLLLLLAALCPLIGGFYINPKTHSLSFEMCNPYDTVFQLNYIWIDTCSTVPCQIPIGQKVLITGSFTYTGISIHSELKLKHRPNWLLNYVYTAATVVENDNEFPEYDRFDFEATVYVDESLAPLKGTLNWRLYDDAENRVACYNIPIQLVL